MSEIRMQCFSVLVGLCCASCGRHRGNDQEAWLEVVTYTEESPQTTSRLQGERPTYLNKVWIRKQIYGLRKIHLHWSFFPWNFYEVISFLNLKQIGVTEEDQVCLLLLPIFLFMYFIIVNIHETCLSLSLFHCVYISQYFIFMKYIWILINIHLFISMVTKIHNKGSWKSVNHKSVFLQNAYYFLRLW